MSFIYEFTCNILKVMRSHSECVECNPGMRIVSFYPATEARNDIQLNFADGRCVVIYPDYSVDGFGPSSDPAAEIAAWGEPLPWLFHPWEEKEEEESRELHGRD